MKSACFFNQTKHNGDKENNAQISYNTEMKCKRKGQFQNSLKL